MYIFFFLQERTALNNLKITRLAYTQSIYPSFQFTPFLYIKNLYAETSYRLILVTRNISEIFLEREAPSITSNQSTHKSQFHYILFLQKCWIPNRKHDQPNFIIYVHHTATRFDVKNHVKIIDINF